MKITAAVVKEKGSNFELTRVTLDAPGPEEVLVKMVATGICHTDMVARDFIMGSPDFPVILGHEGSGIIVKVGQDVHHLREGDHVVLTYGFCGECEICRTHLRVWRLLASWLLLALPQNRWHWRLIFSLPKDIKSGL